MAHIERRKFKERLPSGRVRISVRYRVRYRDWSGKQQAETFSRAADAERRKAEVETELAGGVWRDPRRGEMRLREWAADWIQTRHDLRATTWARLETTMRMQVLPRFGDLPLNKITNAAIRAWVADMLGHDLSAATTRKAVFALRQCLDAAVDDGRLARNPATAVPLPSERAKPPRFLSQSEVTRLVEAMPARYRALVLVGAYGGLRWGEAAGLTRAHVNHQPVMPLVDSTAVEIGGKITLGNEPKTRRSKRTVPIAHSVMHRIEDHLESHVAPEGDALVFTAPQGGPLFRSTFSRDVWQAAAREPAYPASPFTRFATAS